MIKFVADTNTGNQAEVDAISDLTRSRSTWHGLYHALRRNTTTILGPRSNTWKKPLAVRSRQPPGNDTKGPEDTVKSLSTSNNPPPYPSMPFKIHKESGQRSRTRLIRLFKRHGHRCNGGNSTEHQALGMTNKNQTPSSKPQAPSTNHGKQAASTKHQPRESSTKHASNK